jgi:D-alanyl-D-alanine carboxypeptidase
MPNDPSNTLQAVEDAATELVAKTDGPPGIIVVVQRRNDRRVISAGVADLQTGARLRVDDHMRLASVSKAFNGATALSLVTRQVLSLEDTVGKWRPELPREWASITLRQLLNHTSGIPDYSKEKAFIDALLASLLVALSPVQLLSYIEKPKPSFTPGTEYKYSNSDNVIVGLMIEAATGSSYERALHSQVAAPFGLSHTTLPSDAKLPRPFVRGCQRDAMGVPEDVSGGAVGNGVDQRAARARARAQSSPVRRAPAALRARRLRRARLSAIEMRRGDRVRSSGSDQSAQEI